MIQLYVLLTFLMWIFSILGWGSTLLFLSRFKSLKFCLEFSNHLKISVFGLNGLFILSIISLISNFFIPLNEYFSSIILILGIIIAILNWKYIFSWMMRFDILIIILLLLYCSIFTLANCKNGDSFLYHINSIKWVQESVVPYGLANLHGRLGFNSTWFILGAIVQPLKSVTNYPYFIINAILNFFLGTLIFLTIKNNRLFKISISSLFIIFTLFVYIVKLLNNSSPSPDDPVVVLSIFIIYILIYTFEIEKKGNEFYYILMVLSIFLFTIKLSGAWYTFSIPLILLIYFIVAKYLNIPKLLRHFESLSFKFVLFTFFISILLIIPWFIKSIYLSGCLVYPSKIGYFPILKWAVDSTQLIAEANVTKAWAMYPGVDCMKTLNDQLFWYMPWLKRFFTKEPFLIFSFISAKIFILISIFKKNIKISDLLFISIPIFITFTGVIYWFFSAPDPRFGYCYIFPLAFILLSLGIIYSDIYFNIFNLIKKNIHNINFNKNKYCVLCLLLGLILVISGLLFFKGYEEFISINILITERYRLPETIEFWSNQFKSFGIILIILGLLIMFMNRIKINKYKIITIILLLMIVFNVSLYHQEIIQLCKITPFEATPYKTDEGIVIFAPPGKLINGYLVLLESVKKVKNQCDIPLLFSPYFYKSIKIKLSKDGKPIMFIHSDDFKNIDKYKFLFGVNPPIK